MIVQFSLSQSDHYCLLMRVDKNSTAHEALFNATETNPSGGEGPHQIWQVRCNPSDAITILKLAHEVCPQAVPHIRKGIDLSAS
ncbi:MAG: hypothetical protein WD688_03760 [Candidatus Binatia bacterium]